MKTTLYGLLAETPIHPGAGQSSGFVDLPVAREAATDYPVIVGSGMKGALLGMARDLDWDESKRNDVFGKHDNAGGLLVSDARLLLLPIRSLTSSFMWVTCPHVIERYLRDCKRAGHRDDDLDGTTLEDIPGQMPKYRGPRSESGEIFLEERQFAHAGDLPETLIASLKPLIPHQATADRLDKQLIVISNDSFAWFARYGLAVNARNHLDPKTKMTTGGGLWYEETLSPDSLFYWLLAERSEGALEKIKTLFSQRPYLQVGGNETVGQGWFAVSDPLEGGVQ